MKFPRLSFFNFFLALILVLAVWFTYKHFNPPLPDWTTSTVEEGTVSEIISVSGTVDATKTAKLSFPLSGIVEAINVKEGQTVNKGDKLIILRHNDIMAQFRSAKSALMIAQADKSENLNGVTTEEKNIANTKVKIATAELARVSKEQEEKVASAYRTLLSADLTAMATDPKNDNQPPEITGTYNCEEGTYKLAVYRSDAYSNYSYYLSGLETKTLTAYTDSPAPLGNCGLFIKFTPNETYSNTNWEIQIPNSRSNSYINNLNNYRQAIINRDNIVAAAKQNLELAIENEALTTAAPRSESLTRNDAKIIQSEAEIARISSEINDHILTAPFSGIISDIEPTLGETVGLDPVVTMISDDYFEITALIPEIDITKVFIGQKAELVFDAHPKEILKASIIFVSPLAETIAGVSYFKTTMTLDQPVNWLRGGLNADINIIVSEKTNVLKIPKRFLIETDDSYSVLVPDNNQARNLPIKVEFMGNDGYVSITGLNKGDTIIAP